MSIVSESQKELPRCDICNEKKPYCRYNKALDCLVCDECKKHADLAEIVTRDNGK